MDHSWYLVPDGFSDPRISIKLSLGRRSRILRLPTSFTRIFVEVKFWNTLTNNNVKFLPPKETRLD